MKKDNITVIPPTWESLPKVTKDKFLESGQLIHWYINGASNTQTFYTKSEVDALMIKAKDRETNYYGDTDTYLYEALDKYPISGKEIAVLGSVEPWYESVCLVYGGIPTTIEYNKIDTNDDRLNFVTVQDYNKSPKKFPFACSISSFEHDGLGRYGDPVNPDGDIEAMRNVRDNILESNGILFLAVPCGTDKVVFNAHRVYGNRLDKLIEGFEVLDYFPNNINQIRQTDTGRNAVYQPLLVLKNL